MNIYSFSQNNYPSKVVFEGDTLVCITVEQLKKLNNLLLDRLEYIELNDSLYVQIGIYERLVSTLEEEVNLQGMVVKNLTERVIVQDTVIRKVQEENGILKRRIRRLGKVVGYGGCTVIGSVLVVFLLL